MGDIFFIIRMMVITVVVVLIMQIKIGSTTLEQRSHAWIQTSSIAQSLKDVASGALKVLRVGFDEASHQLRENVAVNVEKVKEPESRLSWFKIRRSEAYLKSQEEKRSQQGHEELSEEEIE